MIISCLGVILMVSLQYIVADCLCHKDYVIACTVIVIISFLLAGQGCSPDASRAAQIFTDLALKGHPYAQVGERGWALIPKQWVGLDTPASGEGEREVGPDTQLVVLIPLIFEFELLSLSLSLSLQFALAGMYYAGIGVEQNFKRAFSLYSVSHSVLAAVWEHLCAHF